VLHPTITQAIATTRHQEHLAAAAHAATAAQLRAQRRPPRRPVSRLRPRFHLAARPRPA
jgi:hypothetical protein